MFAFLTLDSVVIQYTIEIRTSSKRDINNDVMLEVDESYRCEFASSQLCLIEWNKQYLLESSLSIG